MLIGIDCSRAFVKQRTGTENYSYLLLKEILKIGQRHTFRLYLRVNGANVEEFVSKVKNELKDVTSEYELVIIEQKWLWTQMGLAIELWRNRVDILFVSAHTLPVFMPKNIKTVVTIHDLGYEFLPQYHQIPHKWWLTFFTEYAVHEASRVIAVSNATKRDLCNKLFVDEHKIEVVYEGYVSRHVDESLEENVLKKYELSFSYMIFVGTVQPRKNLVRAIEAFALFKKSVKDISWQFVIVGGKGWMSDETYAASRKFGVEEDVKFLGYVRDQDVGILWKKARMTFYATLFEGFGIPILESQSLGVPLITSNKEPFTEVGGQACMYVDATDVNAIAQGMREIINDEKLRKSLIDEGLKNVKRFSWEKAARETLKVIESA